jgi:glutathione synthase/RimK-type ligase-like ATP-grasp enzyme
MPDYYDLAVAWDWEYDRDFVAKLEAEIHAHHLLFYSISHHNTHETLKRIQKGDLTFGTFLDRADDASDHFSALTRALRKAGVCFINPPERVNYAADKATMHLEFLTKGINVPFTIIISPYNKKKEVELTLSDLAQLGRPFIIKPANTTGGGIGVILGAESLKDVIDSRQHHKNDKYLLQECIRPSPLDGRKGWFRVFFIFGVVLPCWWNDETHIYGTISRQEIDEYKLKPLIQITRKIQEVCGLDFFSTEIAVTDRGEFSVVDYVNEICDMRLQSKHGDGVPDVIVAEICRRIARHLVKSLKSGG